MVSAFSWSSESRRGRSSCPQEARSWPRPRKKRTKDKQEPKEKAKKDEPKKKVQAPLPLKSNRTIEFTTDEGTWVSLDVSPDGKTIVFDLLGDLYTVGIAGGDAKAITTGLAFDGQPRYSPDGKSIAFVSDHDGAENLWIAASDGIGARPLSKDKQITVCFAVVDARRRLCARLAAAAASLGCLRPLDVPRPRRLGHRDHQGQDQSPTPRTMTTCIRSVPSPPATASTFTTPSGTSCSTPTTT